MLWPGSKEKKEEYGKEPKSSLPQLVKLRQRALQNPHSFNRFISPPALLKPLLLPENTIKKMANQHKKELHSLVVFGLILMIHTVSATQEYKIGGPNGWSPNNPNYNQWAEKNRFQVGDSLLFVYPSEKDSVLQVSNDDYANCNTESPIAKFTDGNTMFKLSHSGAYYFISGVKDNCLKNEKMHLVVMADRSKQSSNTNQTAPPASPPSPPPSDAMETPPSPPPSGSIEIVPAPAPEGEEAPSMPAPPPSAASTVFLSVIGSFGTFVGSSLLLVL